MAELKRTLGLFDTFGLVISAVVGAGIYAVTGIASRVAGPSLIVSVLIAGVVAALTSTSIVQLARAFPREGGEYEYGYKTLSPLAGFLSGWIWNADKVLADAAVALAFATYLSIFLPSLPVQPVAIGVIGAATIINYFGVRTAGTAVDLLSIATLSILFTFVAVGAFFIHPAYFRPFAPFGIEGTLRASAVMFFAYVGFARPVYLVEEIRNPTRNIPRGIFLGLAASAVVYLLVTSIAVGLAGSPALSQSISPLATAVSFTNMPWMPALITVGALIAMFSVLLSDNVGLSRVMFAMGRKGDYPRWLGDVDKRSHLPRKAIVACGLLTSLFVLVVSFANLIQVASFFILVYFALVNLSSVRLKTRSYPIVLSVLGVIGTLGLAFSLTLNIVGAGIVVIAAGVLYLLFRKHGFTRELLLQPEKAEGKREGDRS